MTAVSMTRIELFLIFNSDFTGLQCEDAENPYVNFL